MENVSGIKVESMEGSLAVMAWIEAHAATFEFAASMRDAIRRWGSLTPSQLAAVERCMARDAKPQAVDVSGTGFSALLQAFARAKESRLQYPKLTFENMTFSLAGERSANAGFLYIKNGRDYEAPYIGKVSPQGVFSPGRDCSPEAIALIKRIGVDPLGEAVAYGKRTGNCCACGRPLKDAKSVELGIGPICRKKWFAV